MRQGPRRCPGTSCPHYLDARSLTISPPQRVARAVGARIVRSHRCRARTSRGSWLASLATRLIATARPPPRGCVCGPHRRDELACCAASNAANVLPSSVPYSPTRGASHLDDVTQWCSHVAGVAGTLITRRSRRASLPRTPRSTRARSRCCDRWRCTPATAEHYPTAMATGKRRVQVWTHDPNGGAVPVLQTPSAPESPSYTPADPPLVEVPDVGVRCSCSPVGRT